MDGISCLRACGRARATRGLCGMHYQELATRIRRKELSWGEAERQGLCLPAKKSTAVPWKNRRPKQPSQGE